MYIESAKHMIFVCLYALLSCLQTMYAFIGYETYKSSEHSKIEFQFKRSKNDITEVTVTLVT